MIVDDIDASFGRGLCLLLARWCQGIAESDATRRWAVLPPTSSGLVGERATGSLSATFPAVTIGFLAAPHSTCCQVSWRSHDLSRRSPHSRATGPSSGPKTPGDKVLAASFATRGSRVQIPSAPQPRADVKQGDLGTTHQLASLPETGPQPHWTTSEESHGATRVSPRGPIGETLGECLDERFRKVDRPHRRSSFWVEMAGRPT